VLPGRAAGQPAQAAPAEPCWPGGDGANGQLGNGTVTDKKLPPVELPATTKITQVRAGCFHTVALTSAGQVLAWGGNKDGQLGNGTTTNSDIPLPVSLPAGATIKAIGAGDAHSLALTSTGQLLAWGFNATGDLGDGTTTDRQ
jgi:alpha-tubulin suppressor-like RCC1 family protein